MHITSNGSIYNRWVKLIYDIDKKKYQRITLNICLEEVHNRPYKNLKKKRYDSQGWSVTTFKYYMGYYTSQSLNKSRIDIGQIMRTTNISTELCDHKTCLTITNQRASLSLNYSG